MREGPLRASYDLDLWRRRHDPAALGELTTRFLDSMRKTAAGIAGAFGLDSGAAGDLASQAYFGFAKALEDFREDGKMALRQFASSRIRWHLFKYAKEAYSAARIPRHRMERGVRVSRARFPQDLPGRDLADESPTALEQLTRLRCIAAVREALAALPGAQRAILDLWMQGFGRGETSRRLGCSASVVVRVRSQAVRTLRKRLRGWQDAPARPVGLRRPSPRSA